MYKREEYKHQQEVIDSLIEELKRLQEEITGFDITVTHDMLEQGKLVDGTVYAQKNININILYNQLYTKNENEITGGWKLYKK